MNNISRTITGLLVLTFLFFGLSEMNYTGNIVNSLEKIPIVVAEFNYEDDSFSEDVHKKFISGRISRSKNLKGLCPPIDYAGEHLYSYKWIEGST